MSPADDRVALPAFVAMTVLAGGNGVAIRFSNRELDPLWGAALRFVLAAALLWVAVLALRIALPRGRALAGALLYGALTFGAAFALGYVALVDLHAGLAQTLLALVPLATLLLAFAQRQEQVRRAAVAGALLACVGIAVISRPATGADLHGWSVVAAVASAFCFAQGALLVRRFPPVHPVAMNAVGMTSGSLLLGLGAIVAGDEIAMPGRATTWAAIAYLVAIGSIAVFLLYVVVLRHWTASRTSYEFVLVPIVTLALSAWLDDEAIGGGLLAGGLLVLAGVYVGAIRPSPADGSADRA